MNLFLPSESTYSSVEALDDKRLNKQILECEQILKVALEGSTGYAKHPVVKHYAQYPDFVAYYALICCYEYRRRFKREHSCDKPIRSLFKQKRVFVEKAMDYVPLYAQYSKDDPRCIRETDRTKVYDLFQARLCEKWDNDKEKGRPPKWTNRRVPWFYKEM